MNNHRTLAERLIKRLIDLGYIDSGSTIQRIHRGRHGKAAGTWAWEVINAQGVPARVGSEDTMKECVKAVELSGYRAVGSNSFNVCAEGN